MYCKNCGNLLDPNAAVCIKCGVNTGVGNRFCSPGAAICIKCGAPANGAPAGNGQKSKMAAGLLGIFLGGWVVLNFYLGNRSRGIIQIVVTLVTCGIGAIWGLIEGIMILTGSINTDADGIPLRDC